MLATAELAETQVSRRLKIVLGLLPPDQQDEVMLQSLSPANLRQELFGDCANSFARKLLSDPFY